MPVTVVSGYLGAGKTSVINHMLRNPGGRRLLVMVNDFGALNIDADLLVSEDEDTLTLSNGCICCTMGTELVEALDAALLRRPRPDGLVIEASGVAEPARIAMAAHAEPEMRYAGVVTVVDAAHIAGLLADPLIGAQVGAQLTAADLLLLTKTDLADEAAARDVLAERSSASVLVAPGGVVDPALVLDLRDPVEPGVSGGPAHDHGVQYRSWSTTGGTCARERVRDLLRDPPAGLLRFKGRLVVDDETCVEAHLVGRTWSLTPAPTVAETRAVAIGLAPEFDPEIFETVWLGVTSSER